MRHAPRAAACARAAGPDRPASARSGPVAGTWRASSKRMRAWPRSAGVSLAHSDMRAVMRVRSSGESVLKRAASASHFCLRGASMPGQSLLERRERFLLRRRQRLPADAFFARRTASGATAWRRECSAVRMPARQRGSRPPRRAIARTSPSSRATHADERARRAQGAASWMRLGLHRRRPHSLGGAFRNSDEARVAIGVDRQVVAEERFVDLGSDRDLRASLPVLDQDQAADEGDQRQHGGEAQPPRASG